MRSVVTTTHQYQQRWTRHLFTTQFLFTRNSLTWQSTAVSYWLEWIRSRRSRIFSWLSSNCFSWKLIIGGTVVKYVVLSQSGSTFQLKEGLLYKVNILRGSPLAGKHWQFSHLFAKRLPLWRESGLNKPCTHFGSAAYCSSATYRQAVSNLSWC